MVATVAMITTGEGCEREPLAACENPIPNSELHLRMQCILQLRHELQESKRAAWRAS